MTTLYIYHAVNVLCFSGKWTYAMGKMYKRLRSSEPLLSLPSAKRKKRIEDALFEVTGERYTVKGRVEKYYAADGNGQPVWHIYVEEE